MRGRGHGTPGAGGGRAGAAQQSALTFRVGHRRPMEPRRLGRPREAAQSGTTGTAEGSHFRLKLTTAMPGLQHLHLLGQTAQASPSGLLEPQQDSQPARLPEAPLCVPTGTVREGRELASGPFLGTSALGRNRFPTTRRVPPLQPHTTQSKMLPKISKSNFSHSKSELNSDMN